MNWRELANCRGRVEVDFFPNPDDSKAISLAKAICAECVVREQCLEYALESNQKWGIWGGVESKSREMTAFRRQWLAKKRRESKEST